MAGFSLFRPAWGGLSANAELTVRLAQLNHSGLKSADVRPLFAALSLRSQMLDFSGNLVGLVQIIAWITAARIAGGSINPENDAKLQNPIILTAAVTFAEDQLRHFPSPIFPFEAGMYDAGEYKPLRKHCQRQLAYLTIIASGRIFPVMKIERVRELLESQCKAAGNASRWAEEHGISATYISDVINGRKEPGEKILTALGLRRAVEYQRIITEKEKSGGSLVAQ